VWNRVIPLLVVLALIATGGYYAYGALLRGAEEANAPVYATAQVTRGELVVSVQGTGQMQPKWSSHITAQAGGYLESFSVEEGDEVSQGEIIATLRNEKLGLEIVQLELELDRDVTALSQLLNVPPDQVTVVEPSSGVSIVSPIAGRVVDLKAAADDRLEAGDMVARIVDDSQVVVVAELVPADRQQIEVGQTAYLRMKDFSGEVEGSVVRIDSQPVPKGTFFAYRTTVIAPNPGLLAPGQELDLCFDGKTRQVAVATTIQSYYDETVVWCPADGTVVDVPVRESTRVGENQVLARLGGAETRAYIYGKQLDIKNKQAELAQKRDLQERLVVRSPIDGVVAWTMQDYARELEAGQPIASIIDRRAMQLHLQVDEIDIVHLHEGQEGRVTIDALPGQSFPATVKRVDLMGHENEGVVRYSVLVEVQDTGSVHPGMTGNVDIFIDRREDVLLVPIEAVYDEDGQAMVEILRDGRVEEAPIEVGLMNSRYAELVSGLDEGDTVITGSSGDVLESEQAPGSDEPMDLEPGRPEPARPGRG